VRGFPVEVSPEAAAAHDAALVLDLHNDVLTKLTHMPGYDFSREHAPATFYNPLRLDLDLPRIRRGGIDALGCLMFAGFKFDRSRRRFWRQLDCARALAQRHPDAIALARTADDIRAARASGRLALFLGVEGSYAIDDDVAGGVARLAEAGVRFLGPLWERDSRSGTSCRTPADLPRLTELLWRRGWREPRLSKVLGGNALRYLSQS
jgi:membrane dipeptidase